jgi:hypothetical protein
LLRDSVQQSSQFRQFLTVTMTLSSDGWSATVCFIAGIYISITPKYGAQPMLLESSLADFSVR